MSASGALRKILDLESKKGFADTAVMGGLDAFLRRWLVQISETVPAPRHVKKLRALAAPGYAALDRKARKKWAGDMLAFLDSLDKGQPDTSPPLPKGEERGFPVKSLPTSLCQREGKGAEPRPAKTAALPAIDAPIISLKGIRETTASRFKKLGVATIRDLLFFFPHRHIDYSQVKKISGLSAGQEETIIANIWETSVVRPGGRRSTEAIVGDETGNIRVIWFNNPYLAKSLHSGDRVVISGKVSVFNGRHVFESPEWEVLSDKELIHTGRLVPVYPLTAGLYQRQVRKLIKEAVDGWAGQLAEFLPAALRERRSLLSLSEAISQAHFPDSEEIKDRARVRLAFDELFLLQLGVLDRKREWRESQPGTPVDINKTVLARFINSLPFKLTAAQERVMGEITGDLQKTTPMSRLLQGEVGSGKTVIATTALLLAAAGGFQGALMAPTEILAEQHFATMRHLLSRTGQEEKVEENLYSYSGVIPRPLTIALLIGEIKKSKKQGIQAQIAAGGADIVIGTHALIQKGVEFKRLAVAVVDEQHRFGVAQRSGLRQKGFNPHLLVMTATPIPRTLALTLYGDLDLSVINELPPGRQTIRTRWLQPEQRESAYAFIRKQVAAGRQAFIICPLVEESEAVQARAAVAEYERLSRDVFPDLRLGLLHGRMSAAEKDSEMRRFRSGELDILVSTPVVEVGIDVPNATVMLVESADRFGLSQLHQFRGRVGRGTEQSYCMLLAENSSEISRQRLDIIERVQDGFKLAEEDLKLRGPGEFFGTRQSGLPDLRMARLSDTALLEQARAEANRLFETDPRLEKAEHSPLKREVGRVWRKEAEIS